MEKTPDYYQLTTTRINKIIDMWDPLMAEGFCEMLHETLNDQKHAEDLYNITCRYIEQLKIIFADTK